MFCVLMTPGTKRLYDLYVTEKQAAVGATGNTVLFKAALPYPYARAYTDGIRIDDATNLADAVNKAQQAIDALLLSTDENLMWLLWRELMPEDKEKTFTTLTEHRDPPIEYHWFTEAGALAYLLDHVNDWVEIFTTIECSLAEQEEQEVTSSTQ